MPFSSKEKAKWAAKAKRFTERMSAVDLMRFVQDAPKIIQNLKEGSEDLTNPDRKWSEGQHMVFSAYYSSCVERLQELSH